MSIIWWEKTIEYYFIQKHIDLKMLIAPLDGNQEKAGDAIFSSEGSWVLIEFKRNQKSISDEIEKFINYDKAKKELESTSKHHLIIYGESVDDKLNLVACHYFSEKKITMNEALASGIEKDTFITYIEKFVSYKKNSSSGSGSYGFVAGVSSNGKLTKCMKISEFAEIAGMNLNMGFEKEVEKTQTYGLSGP